MNIDKIKSSKNFEEFVMVKGVEFAKMNLNEDTVYYFVGPDGFVNPLKIAEVYNKNNYTMGRMYESEEEVMIDDDGIHYDYQF